jgi:hypothetical protein
MSKTITPEQLLAILSDMYFKWVYPTDAEGKLTGSPKKFYQFPYDEGTTHFLAEKLNQFFACE